MAVDSRYDKARAYKSTNTRAEVDTSSFSSKKTKKYSKKIMKSPLLLIIVITAIVGILGGFFLTKALSKFEMNKYYVGGVAAPENDYVIIDVSAHKENLETVAGESNTELTMEQVYLTLGIEDKGVYIKFFGMDISDTVKTRYFYREDITFDPQEVNGIDVKTPGVYYIEYTSSHFAYKNVTLIRTIIVTGVEVDG